MWSRAEERPLTKEEFAEIKRINREVSSQITWMSDMENYGLADLRVTEPRLQKRGHRSLRLRYGDREDYALTKLSRLIKAGIPKSRLQPARVSIPRAASIHLVLVVHTGAEPLILDSYDNRVEKVADMQSRWGWRFLTPLAQR